MPRGAADAFKPLVVGAPRSGFALLASVIIHLTPHARGRWSLRQEVFNSLLAGVDAIIADAIVREFAAHGITGDLIYNPNFRRLTGGPKWLREDDVESACFRKYIGVRGMGDFTLVTSHPRQVLDVDEVVHSHTAPGLWLSHPGYADYTKFASLRNPVGVLNSSVFSINALASEYIQKFVPRDRDNDLQRQRLALYKLTDLTFVRGLVQFLVEYLEDFVKYWRRYHVMRWEDLILTPERAIARLADDAGIPLRGEQAVSIWARLDHVNLTGHHRHNYREGKGIVGNWREWLVNEHLELFASMGLEPLMVELGYGPMPSLDEAAYTPFQRKVADFIRRGAICRETEDEDLFTFAFNKSNIVSQAFPFKRYPWRRWTRIERSIFADEQIQARVWDAAEDAAARINDALAGFLGDEHRDVDDLRATLDDFPRRYPELFALAPGSMEAALARARASLDRAAASGRRSAVSLAVPFRPNPILVETIGTYNVVAFEDQYYGVPHDYGEFPDGHAGELDARIVRRPTLAEAIAAVSARQGAPLSPAAAPPASGATVTAAARLSFVDPFAEAYAALCRQHLDEGRRAIVLTPFNDFAREVHRCIAVDAERAGARILFAGADRQIPDRLGSGRVDDGDLVLVCESNEPELSDRLVELVDFAGAVVAPRTERFWEKQPLFLISIPKAGTHLLYSLAEAMGYRAAVTLHDDPAPGCWYCVEFSNSHTVARDFFVDSVRRAAFGNRHHPFMRSPALFIYRNPLDIVASEASYYHQEGKTAFAGYFAALDAEERLLRLIDDPWLLGTIRDRVGGFVPWLELPNVVPISFEELVGPQGAGSEDLQRRAVWSLQLKLHVPGSPEAIAGRVFNPDSPTFDTGRIGRYRELFSDRAYARFQALPQDFMQAYGFDGSGATSVVKVPGRAEEFRRRPVRLASAPLAEPITVQSGYFGFNIVRFRDEYLVVSQAAGALDLTTADLEGLEAAGRIARAATAEEARRTAERHAITAVAERIIAEEPRLHSDAPADMPPGGAVIRSHQPRLVRALEEFNIVEYGRQFFAVARSLGPIDLAASDVPALIASGDLLTAESLEAVEALAAGKHGNEAHRQVSQAAADTPAAAGHSGRTTDELRIRLTTLERTLSTLRAELASREQVAASELSRVTEIERRLDALRTQVHDREVSLASLAEENHALRSWIHELHSRLAAAKGRGWRSFFRVRT